LAIKSEDFLPQRLTGEGTREHTYGRYHDERL